LITNHYSDGKAHTNREPVTGPVQSPALFGEMWELQNYHPLNQDSKHSFKYVEIRNGKRPLGRPRHRLEDNIKVDLQKVGCVGLDWIKLVQVRDRCWTLVKAVMNLQVP